MALLSLSALGAAIFIGFFRQMNTGLLSIALALVVGKAAGLSDMDILEGFNAPLFLMLLGVTYLFGLADGNGALRLLAEKIVSLSGRHTWLVPIVMYFLAAGISALGPGTIPTTAIMMVLGMSLAAEMKINPAMLAAIVFLGAAGGGMSPLAATGIIGVNLCSDFGLYHIEKPLLINGMLSSSVYAFLVYMAFGGFRLRNRSGGVVRKYGSFDRRQKMTLLAIGIMILAVIVFKVNVGLAGFGAGAVLSFFHAADEREALKKIPWGTLLLICGVGVLMNVIIKTGGIDLLSGVLADLMNDKTAASVLGMTAGVMSWFSSTSGVVMPTLIPAIPHIMDQMSGPVNPVEWVTAISMIANTAGISPLSTGGALALAAYSSENGADEEEMQGLFIRMFAISAAGVLSLSLFAYFGFYRWLL